jgi:4-hydroxythreonine-4-phosphate dehydrogenase
MSHLPCIAFTPGEPAGIGPDLAILAFDQLNSGACSLAIVADPELLAQRARQLGRPLTLPRWERERPGAGILPVHTRAQVRAGVLDAANSPYVLETLERAADGCLRGEFDALLTGPVHKGIINEAGTPFTGHTEFLAQHSGSKQVVMMLVARTDSARLQTHGDTRASLRVGRSRHPASGDTRASLRVALVTTHLPLHAVPAAITPERLEATIRILHEELQARFRIHSPTISVCGLNPHAGEGGHLGNEEIDVIAPVVDRLQALGLNLRGPIPADTAFTPASLEGVDAVLAMFHDQGLPVLKYAGFGTAVNVTLGLPYVRTSVDHGTALDRAGTGNIDSGSLVAALEQALTLVAP